MNRVLKFRVWNTYQKKFLESDQIGISGIGTILTYDWHDDNGKSWNTDCWNGNNLCVVQQFTGLLDKNGKEIYEGDIIGSHVSQKPCNYIVKWGETRSDYCGFVLNTVFINPPKFTYIIHNFKMWMAEGFEVLGNIFESPNLLS